MTHHRDPSAAEPQSKQESIFHHRGTEFAEFGVFRNQGLVTLGPLRLRGENSLGPIESAWLLENLRGPRKFLTIVVQRTQRV
jgi:hypothetical protein